jgi:hypothetical protein
MVRDHAAGRSWRSSEASNLLDEDLYLILRDSAVAVLVELLEAGVKFLVREFS